MSDTICFAAHIEPLQSIEDYPYWAEQMKLLFKAKNIDDFLDDDGCDIASMHQNRQDAEALLLIYTLVSKQIRYTLIDHRFELPWQAWEFLRNRFCMVSDDTDYDNLNFSRPSST